MTIFQVKEKLPSSQSRMIWKANSNYSRLGQALNKQTNAIEDQGEEQRTAFEEYRNQVANICSNT